jgi:DNA invertase Pin-like site-specific DNA recombinase
MLMSFTEFEREMIAERTRDKIAGARRKGKWTGPSALFRLATRARSPSIARTRSGSVDHLCNKTSRRLTAVAPSIVVPA